VSSFDRLASTVDQRWNILSLHALVLAGMPVTFPAHQALVLPLKLRWPGLDGVALCIGSAAPDLSYALLHTNWQFDAHYTWAVVWWCLPVTLLLCWWLRRGLFAHAALWAPPALRPGLQRSAARPANLRNAGHAVLGAALGIASHVGWDSFTHGSSPVSDRIRILNRIVVTTPVPMTLARTLQYAGHTIGSMLALWMLVRVWRTASPAGQASSGKWVQHPLRQYAPTLWLGGAVLLGAVVALVSNALMPHEIAAALLRGFWAGLVALTVLVALARLIGRK
jgi:Domain of unknown function (DUF4184)